MSDNILDSLVKTEFSVEENKSTTINDAPPSLTSMTRLVITEKMLIFKKNIFYRMMAFIFSPGAITVSVIFTAKGFTCFILVYPIYGR